MRIAPALGQTMRRRAPSAHAEVAQDEQDNDHGADEPDDPIHDSIPLPTLKGTKRVPLAHCILAPAEPLYVRAAKSSVCWRTLHHGKEIQAPQTE